MPRLRQLECHIELAKSNLKLKEYNTTYVDGFVETFVAIPDQPTGFSVHLTSHGYIAPGLSMFVYIDGVYQCNRNRRGLVISDDTKSPKHTEVNFRVRQKEEKQESGRFIGREWSFEKLNVVSADAAPDLNPGVLGNIGTIEVVVLRCQDHPANYFHSRVNAKEKLREEAATRRPSIVASVKAASAKQDGEDWDFVGGMGGMFDGSSDDPRMGERQFTLDGHYTEHAPSYSYGSGSYDEQPPPNLHHGHPQYVSTRGTGPLQDHHHFYEHVPPPGYHRVYEAPRWAHDQRDSRAHATHYGSTVPPPPPQPYWQGHGPSFQYYRRDWHPDVYCGPPPPLSSLHYDELSRRRDSSPESYSSYFVASSPEQQYRRVDLQGDYTVDSPIPRSYPRAPDPPPNRNPYRSHSYCGSRDDAPLKGHEDAFRRHGAGHTHHAAGGMEDPIQYRDHSGVRGHSGSVCDVIDESEVHHNKEYCQYHCSERPSGRSYSANNHAASGRGSSNGGQTSGSRTVSWDLEPENCEECSCGARVRKYPSGEGTRDLQVVRHPSRQRQAGTSEGHSGFGRYSTQHSSHGRNEDSGHRFSGSTNVSNNNTHNKCRNASGEQNKVSGSWNTKSTTAANESVGRMDSSRPNVNATNGRCEGGDKGMKLNSHLSCTDKSSPIGEDEDEDEAPRCDGCQETFTGAYWHCGICNDGDYDLCAICYDKGIRCSIKGHELVKNWLEKVDAGAGEDGNGSADHNDWSRTNEHYNSKNNNENDRDEGSKELRATGSWDSQVNQNDSSGWQEATNNGQTSGDANNWDNQTDRSTCGDQDASKDMTWEDSTGQENSNADMPKNETSDQWGWSGTSSGDNSNDTNENCWKADDNTKAGGDDWDASGQADSFDQQGNSNADRGDSHSQNDNGQSWEASSNNNTKDQTTKGSTNNIERSSNGPPVRMRGGAGGSPSSEETYIKPYWTNWKIRPSKDEDRTKVSKGRSEQVYVALEEPLHTIPDSAAQEKKIEHQVRAGKGVVYEHKVGKPMYIDRMDQPYAVFRFKYRSKEMLQKILDIKIEEDENDMKERLETMTKDQIIEELLRARLCEMHLLTFIAATPSAAAAPTSKPSSKDTTESTTRNVDMSWRQKSQTGGATRKLSQSKQSSSDKTTSGNKVDGSDKQNVDEKKSNGWEKSNNVPGAWDDGKTQQKTGADKMAWNGNEEDATPQGVEW